MNQDIGQERPVPWWVGLLFFSALLVAIAVFTVILSIVPAVTGRSEWLLLLASPAGLLVQVGVMSGVMAALALLAPRLAGVPVRRWLRIAAASPRVIAVAALGVLGIGFLVDEVTFVLHGLAPSFFTADGLSFFNRLFAEASPVLYVFLTMIVMAGPGIGEELFFRGLMIRSFEIRLPGWAAVLLSSAMFGLIHFDRLQSPGAGLIGLYLGFLVLRTGSLWPAVVAHALNNLTCALFARFGPAGTAPVWETGHPWWILTAAVLVTGASIASLLWWTQRPSEVAGALDMNINGPPA